MYGSVNKATADLKKLLAAALVRSDQDRDKSRDKCNNCGALGHWAKDCRKKSKGGSGNRFNSGDKSKRNNPRKNNSKRGGVSNRTPAPKDGESEM